ncbi:hypothetical protein FB451DRAFT_1365737 [Mycena latifolia]|nr:hypothetical protein FB451DRAFT_1365737 [Mycena latifolia]
MLNKLISCTLLFFALTQGVLSASPILLPCDGPYAHPVSSAASGTGACSRDIREVGCCVLHKEIFAMLGFEWRSVVSWKGGEGGMWCCAKVAQVSSLGDGVNIHNNDERQAGILVAVWAFGHVGDSTPATSAVETRCEISALEPKLDTDTPALQIQSLVHVRWMTRTNQTLQGSRGGIATMQCRDLPTGQRAGDETRGSICSGEGRLRATAAEIYKIHMAEQWRRRICGVNAPATQGTRRLESAEADIDCGIDEAPVALSKFVAEIEPESKEE